ncbi:TPA: hypothetical protein NGU26_001157 [Vibrio parahaemolyticus]|nr:hypothetical protein [Vibrio parahaemolyticus]
MSIGSVHSVELAEEKDRDNKRKAIARCAARYVLNGHNQEDAIKRATALIEAQQEAVFNEEYYEDENNIIHFLDTSLEDPKTLSGQESQLKAITSSLMAGMD